MKFLLWVAIGVWVWPFVEKQIFFNLAKTGE